VGIGALLERGWRWARDEEFSPFGEDGTVLTTPDSGMYMVSGQTMVQMGRHSSVTKLWEHHTSLGVGPETIGIWGGSPAHSS
jgi:hypothetical protein